MEDWKIIEEYPNYMVSSEGKVKSIERNDGRGRHKKGKILSPRYNTRGYISVVLYKNGKPQTFRVNRLVAQVFIPNPDNKPYVDHINGDRADNRVCNLRWVTHKENMNNPLTILKFKNNKNKQKIATECSRLKTSKPVLQFSKNGIAHLLLNEMGILMLQVLENAVEVNLKCMADIFGGLRMNMNGYHSKCLI